VEFYGLEEVDKAVAAIQRREEKSLLARPNVIGVGVGRKAVGGFETNEPCLLVLVSRKAPESELAPEARIPTLVEHCKTDVIEVGSVAAMEAPEPSAAGANSLSCRVRPAQGGFSVGRVAGSSGSIAAGVIEAGKATRSCNPALRTAALRPTTRSVVWLASCPCTSTSNPTSSMPRSPR